MEMQLDLELEHELIQRTDHALVCGASNLPRSHRRELRFDGRRLYTKLIQYRHDRFDDTLRQVLDAFRYDNHGKQCPFADAQNQVAWPGD